MSNHVASARFDHENARSAPLGPREPRDLSTLTPEDFPALSPADRNRLYQADAERYRELREAAPKTTGTR